MRTGEGKTLVAILPAYLHALTGRGVHVVTANDYLAVVMERGWVQFFLCWVLVCLLLTVKIFYIYDPSNCYQNRR